MHSKMNFRNIIFAHTNAYSHHLRVKKKTKIEINMVKHCLVETQVKPKKLSQVSYSLYTMVHSVNE